MALLKTEAIVLRSAKMGETSKRLTLYTLNSGIVTVVAKGARGPKSRYGGSLEPLTALEIVYYDKPSRELQFLSQVSIVYSPKRLLGEPERAFLAMACAEMVMKFEATQESNPGVFRLLRSTIEAFDQPGSVDALIFFAFELQLLRLLGFAPALDRCGRCGARESASWAFHIPNGVLTCKTCAEVLHSEISLPAAALSALRTLARTPLRQASAAQVAPECHADMHRFLVAFYEYHVESYRFLRSLKVLKAMKNLATGVSPAATANNEPDNPAGPANG